MAWRLAICPTRRSPSSEKATIDAVVRLPSRFASTTGTVASTIAAQLFVVPRSMPRILLIVDDGRKNCLIVRGFAAPKARTQGPQGLQGRKSPVPAVLAVLGVLDCPWSGCGEQTPGPTAPAPPPHRPAPASPRSSPQRPRRERRP